jgi:uncharacterized protein
MKKAAIILFGKLPVQGSVKTRLARDVGHLAATEFYSVCLNTIFKESLLAASRTGADVYFCFSNAGDEQAVRALTPSDIQIFPQVDETLPVRIHTSFEYLFKQGYRSICIFSTDVPALNSSQIETALRNLEDFDAVVGADGDGGYFALGLSEYNPAVFDVVYSETSSMFDQTLAQLNAAHLSAHVLETCHDVDTMSDLESFKHSHTALWKTHYADIFDRQKSSQL